MKTLMYEIKRILHNLKVDVYVLLGIYRCKSFLMSLKREEVEELTKEEFYEMVEKVKSYMRGKDVSFDGKVGVLLKKAIISHELNFKGKLWRPLTR